MPLVTPRIRFSGSDAIDRNIRKMVPKSMRKISNNCGLGKIEILWRHIDRVVNDFVTIDDEVGGGGRREIKKAWRYIWTAPNCIKNLSCCYKQQFKRELIRLFIYYCWILGVELRIWTSMEAQSTSQPEYLFRTKRYIF